MRPIALVAAFTTAAAAFPACGQAVSPLPLRGVPQTQVASPQPMQLILPPSNVPKALKGKSISVALAIDTAGTVTHVTITPTITDSNYAKEFASELFKTKFRPARDSLGRTVPGALVMSIRF